jgi:uncharacterized protein (DUF111 family)
MPDDHAEEVPVPCPRCGKLHRIPVKEAEESAHVTTPCGAVIGSAGVLRRKRDIDERTGQFRGRLHQPK